MLIAMLSFMRRNLFRLSLAKGLCNNIIILTMIPVVADAQEVPKTCPAADVQSIVVEVESEVIVLRNTTAEKIVILQSRAVPDKSEVAQKAVYALSYGPILGAMDSTHVETAILCTVKGIQVIATVKRTADYHGGVEKNILWRPRIKTLISPRQSEVELNIEWRMLLTSGVEVREASTPPYKKESYPIILTKEINTLSETP